MEAMEGRGGEWEGEGGGDGANLLNEGRVLEPSPAANTHVHSTDTHLASDAKKYSTCFSSSTVKCVKLLARLRSKSAGGVAEVGDVGRWEENVNVGPAGPKPA